MDQVIYNKIRDLMKESPRGEAQEMARYIAKEDFALIWAIVEDWLELGVRTWSNAYDDLAHPRRRGRTGLTASQVKNLTRMREKGHTVALMNGFYRWTKGHDDTMTRAMVQRMLKKGLVEFVEIGPPLGRELRITDWGLKMLEIAEIKGINYAM